MKKNILLTVVAIIALCIALSGCAQNSNVNYVPANRAQNNTAADNTANNTNTSDQPGDNTADNTNNIQNNSNNTGNIPDIWIITQIDEVNNNNQIIGSSTVFDYNEHGDLIRKQTVPKDDTENTSVTEMEYTYDDKDRVVSKTVKDSGSSDTYDYEYDEDILSHEFRSHSNSEGVLEYTCDTTYNKAGNRSFSIEIRYNKDGDVINRIETTYEYDKQGILIKEDAKSVMTGNQRVITYTYDEKGDLITQTVEPEDPQYKNEDYAYSYSKDGRLLKITRTVHEEEDAYVTETRYDYTYYGTKNKESVFTNGVSDTWSVTQYDDLGHEVLKYQAANYGGPAIEGTLNKITWMKLADYLAAKEPAEQNTDGQNK